jgi:spermidine/putrescine transport system ATP-binding protein
VPGDVELVGLVKRFDEVVAVDGIDVHVAGGEFFSLLGPSGCGKTTTLRLIAGFEQPSAGRILVDGADMATTPPHKRPVNTVFQSYALFPFLTVFDNVAFGLRFQKSGKQDVKARVGRALDLVRLSGFEKRRPSQLSGGQQQRVALARALVLNPKVLLLDEPLGALDAKLRKTLQVELKALQEEVGITFVYVTHDQEEALTMSDRIAVMSAGNVMQIGSPSEIYEEPQSEYVADFLGVSNVISGEARRDGDGECVIKAGDFELRAMQGAIDTTGPVRAVIRPERVDLEPYGTTGPNRVPGMVERLVFLGPTTTVIVRLAPGDALQATLLNHGQDVVFEQGSAVSVHLPPDALRVLRPSEARVEEGIDATT